MGKAKLKMMPDTSIRINSVDRKTGGSLISPVVDKRRSVFKSKPGNESGFTSSKPVEFKTKKNTSNNKKADWDHSVFKDAWVIFKVGKFMNAGKPSRHWILTINEYF